MSRARKRHLVMRTYLSYGHLGWDVSQTALNAIDGYGCSLRRRGYRAPLRSRELGSRSKWTGRRGRGKVESAEHVVNSNLVARLAADCLDAGRCAECHGGRRLVPVVPGTIGYGDSADP